MLGSQPMPRESLMLVQEKRRSQREDERRRNRRIPIEDVTVEVYTDEGAPDKPEVCDIVNLSEGGMLIRCGHDYTVSQLLRLTFMVPGTIIIVRTDANVVHMYTNRSGQYVGTEFGSLGPAERKGISRFIQRRKNN